MFQREYDISCILDMNERISVQNAINGANAACSDTVDAWQYIELGHLMCDLDRRLGAQDHIPQTIFTSILNGNHSMSTTVLTLQSIAQGYGTWRQIREEENSRCEGSTNFWNTWRNIRLTPYYQSMSAGGSRVNIGPILENFLFLRASRNEGYSDERDRIYGELLDHLGQSLQEKISILSQIVTVEESPYCSELLTALKKSLDYQNSLQGENDRIVEEALHTLRCAIESGNPVALKAALHPSWYSVKFHNSDLYKNGLILLSQFS